MKKPCSFALLGLAAFGLGPAVAAHAQFSASFYNFLPGAATNIDAAEALFVGPPAATATPLTLNYADGTDDGSIGGGTLFPAGVNADNFGLNATGVVSGLAGPTAFTLGVNSDDGFRLRLNGTTIAEFTGTRGAADTLTASPVTLNNGDVLRLTYFEAGGLNEVEFFAVGAGGTRALVGDVGSGIGIGAAVPEPSTWALLLTAGGLGGALTHRRRRQVGRC